MKQKGFAPIIILLTLLIVCGAIGGFIYLENKSKQSPVGSSRPTSSPTQPQVSVVPITSQRDQTANWKTVNYTPNATGIFQVKFSANLPPEMNNFYCGNNGCWIIDSMLPTGATISLVEGGRLGSWLPDLKWIDIVNTLNSKHIPFTKTQISGKNAFRLTIAAQQFQPFSSPVDQTIPLDGIVIQLDDRRWVSIFLYKFNDQAKNELPSSQEKEQFDLILSTFRFTK